MVSSYVEGYDERIPGRRHKGIVRKKGEKTKGWAKSARKSRRESQ